MKNLQKNIVLILLFAVSISCNNGKQEHHKAVFNKENTKDFIPENQTDRIKVAFLIYPEIAILDMTGPMDAFIKINRMTKNQYEVYTVSETKDMITTQGHILEIRADYVFEEAPKPDIFIIPGAKVDKVEAMVEKTVYAQYIQETSAKANITMSVCTGSFALGKLGILDGKKATTHWILSNKFEDDFKKTELVRNVRYVKDGNIITTSGVTTGIDGAIAIISKYSSPDFAAMISRGLQYETKSVDQWPKLPSKPMKHGDSSPID
ncbi:DJ-1/PfpI family protein [Aquimarina sp. U1-2]|uniref:DJ-1/PfpI family protein n=1 Tax=Aquimarina sp. U1-2 TaxID=2823141 RepID=UPI001AECAEEB|nr:DJ-1/PfpI family protein [Aquimarina sp. U1-2]MBP2833450.1 DJ-1/PfpI family protein [Aquimarina sp. U1-2]